MKFPLIMGVVNITPDSFSDGGRFLHTQDAIQHALQLIDEGADILDIGGESTRPGAESVSEAVELERVVPVIRGIRQHNTSIPISIDTSRASVARVCVAEGATMINDVTAGRRDKVDGHAQGTDSSPMFTAAAELNVPLVLMHMQGEPSTMQSSPSYADVVSEVQTFLIERVNAARNAGVREVYVDPGIGFGKQVEHNLDLLKHLDTFASIAPVVLGISRKRFIGTLLGIENAQDRDTGTMLLHALLLQKQVSVIRVHNVALASQLKALDKSLSANPRID